MAYRNGHDKRGKAVPGFSKVREIGKNSTGPGFSKARETGKSSAGPGFSKAREAGKVSAESGRSTRPLRGRMETGGPAEQSRNRGGKGRQPERWPKWSGDSPRFYDVPPAARRQPLPLREGTERTGFPQAEPVNLLYGRNPIREALKAGRDIEKMMVVKGDLSGSAREIVALAERTGINVQFVDRSRLDAITPSHQGMVAFASAYPYASLDDILQLASERGEDPFLVILDKVTDPRNLGAIIRTAACVGAHGVVVPLHRAVGLTPAAVKASAGAVEHVKVARVVNISRIIQELKDQGVWIYAADSSGADYREVSLAGPAALVIGGESEGLSSRIRQQSDRVLSIPMRGGLGSLNASVAAAILMYAIFSSR